MTVSPPTRSDDGILTKAVAGTVDETVTRLTGLVEARGMMTFTIIDHSGEAERVGLQLRDTKVVIFGSPATGTPIMQMSPLTALDLPSQGAGLAGRRGHQGQLHRPGGAGRPAWTYGGAGVPPGRDRPAHRRTSDLSECLTNRRPGPIDLSAVPLALVTRTRTLRWGVDARGPVVIDVLGPLGP